jgi:D-apiose dehydrogenase
MTVLTAQLGHACPAIVGEDRAAIVLQAAAGALVTVAADQCVPGESATLVDRLLLVGERGTIRFDGDRLVCAGDQPARVYVDLGASYGDSYAATIAHFVDCLADGRPFETEIADNLETLRLVERIYAIATR